MGFLDLFKPRPQVPTVQSILPQPAVNEITHGRLPIINTNKIFLKGGETCHYIDKAIYEKKIVKKRYVRHSYGSSYKGLILKDVRHSHGGGTTDVVDNVHYETYRGILYITNRRIIFQGEQEGFDIKVSDLVAIQPYGNCVELQCSKESYKIFVPNGVITHAVLHLIRR
jgi:hypothetical protein